MKALTIGKVAKASGVGIETIRYYEKEGLLEPPQRTESNYRIYSETSIAHLRFIRHAKSLGFSLKEIKVLLSLSHNPKAHKSAVKEQIEAKISKVKKKIADLQKIQGILESLDHCCDGQGQTDDCPILRVLEGENEVEETLDSLQQ